MDQEKKNIQDLLDIQGRDGNWNNSPYMCGMFNGLELAMSVLEHRDPKYRSLKPQDNHEARTQRALLKKQKRAARRKQRGTEGTHE